PPQLSQPRPPADRVAPGDVLGVFVEAFPGEHETLIAPPVHMSPLIQMRDQRRLPPATGYPIPVEEDGTVYLPSAGPLSVQGMSLAEAREAIRRFYVSKRLIKEEGRLVLVSLLQPRQSQVIVLRQE